MLPVDPATGKTMTLNAASMGFKNQGQFIAALHVSQNLGISFTDLKSHMVTKQTTAAGTTVQQTGSLGQAIQAVKGTTNTETTAAVTHAQHETDEDLKVTTSTQTSTRPGKSKNKTSTGN